MSETTDTDGYTDPILCRHCQAQTPLRRATSFVQVLRDDFTPIEVTERWVLLHCPKCDGVSLQKRVTDDVPGENMDVPACTVVYPGETHPPVGLPSSVESAFVEATRAASVSTSLSGVGFRRVLELVCRDRDVDERTLAKGIEKLVESENLTSRLSQLAHAVRALGNRGAHDWEELSHDEVGNAAALCRAVLEVVYSAPHLIGKATKSTS